MTIYQGQKWMFYKINVKVNIKSLANKLVGEIFSFCWWTDWEKICGWVVWSQLEFCQYWERELNNLWPDGNLGENRSGQIFSYCSFPPYWIDIDNGWYLILKFFTFLPYTDILSLNRTDVFSFNLKNQFPSKFQWSFSKWQSRVFPLLPKIVLCKYSE